MNKKLYILPILAVAALSSCSNQEDPIFDQSAADRLDAAKKEYTAALCDKGGAWMMEYFANSGEEGYLMVMEFSKDGSVNVTGNFKWLDNQMTSDRSAFEVIADDGPVLTFSSYNNVFHIFSDPNNITGPYAPTNPDLNNEDINETGYGHNGDYEFNIMELNEQGDSIRLRGKKRGITTWLIRLPEGTDAAAHLAEVTEKASNMLSSKFPKLYLTDATGEVFVVKDAYKGVMSAYPLDGDPVTQTKSANAIITDKGIRFMDPFRIPRADVNAERFEVEEMTLQPDGTLKTADGALLTAPTPVELLNDGSRQWKIVLETMTGDYKDLFDQVASEASRIWNGKRDLTGIAFSYRALSGIGILPVLQLTFGTYKVEFYFKYSETEGNEVKMLYEANTANANTFVRSIPLLTTLYQRFLDQSSYQFEAPNPLVPTLIHVKDINTGMGFDIELV